MKLKVVLSFTAFLFLSLVSVPAQSPGKVLSRAAKAMGGEKALKSITSRQITGHITRLSDGVGGSYRIQMAQPNLYNESYDLNGFEAANGFNGKSGWTRDSKIGLKTLTGDAGREFQAAAAFRNSLWLNAKTDKSKLYFERTNCP